MRKLDLRTGTPVWTTYRGQRVPERALTRDIEAGVLVVGMGISGAMTADLLTEVGHVVLATGYELMDAVSNDRHQIISTFAMATRRQPKASLWPGEALIWEASDPYLYLRTTHDGRVICGGEDEAFADEAARDALMPDKIGRIAAKLGKLLPAIDPTPEFAWAGSFGTTRTGLPLIGPLPGRPRLFALMGYGGNGITFSRIAAETVRTALAGHRDTDADLFALQ